MYIPSVKEIIELLKTGATIEAREKVMELRLAALALQEENLQQRQQIADLQHKLELRALTFDGRVYWAPSQDPNTQPDGPFCPHCADTTYKRVRLQDWRKGYAAPGWYCTACKELFATEPAKPIRLLAR